MTGIWLDGERIDPTALAVLGQGGEAEVYDLGDGRALKLYKRPDHPDVAGDPMRVAAAAARLTEIEAKPRHRRGRAVDLAALVACFRHLHDTVSALHRAGVVVGDFNDGNVLVDRDRCHLIDADSLQYARWRCSMFTDRFVDPRLCDRGAAVPVLRQPHDEASDWFAFTTMLFRALTWVGPFGGVHQPSDPKARVAPAARALRGPSVFGSDVIYPRAAAPLAGLPDALAAYFREVFDGDRRGRFPRARLDDLPLARCAGCAIDHARSRCPACRHAAPMVAITHAITAVAIDPRTVRRTTWPVAVGAPTSGAVASGAVASGALASGAPAVWISGGNLVRAGVLGPEPIGQIVPGASHAWVGPHLGAGWWRAGGYAIAFTFSPARRGLDDRARLPALRGRVVEQGAILGEDRAWLWWREADAGVTPPPGPPTKTRDDSCSRSDPHLDFAARSFSGSGTVRLMSADQQGDQASEGPDAARAFSMRALVLDGTLGGARAGMTAVEIEDRLGPPDETGGSWPVEIWRYGLFEIHFERQRATMIYTDYVDALDPGAGRTLERWVFPPAEKITLEDVRARLAAEGLDVAVAADAFGHDVMRFPSGCRLGFEPGAHGNHWCTLVVEPIAS